jgi:D-arabinose 1-dehydrogenase-like Zn-dependent alcohol dehydrogenase
MKSKAYIKNTADSSIEYKEVDIYPKDTDVVIKTTHVGLSKGDIFILDNKWNTTCYPAVGTCESVGIVEEVGREAQGFSVGDRVGVGYILGSCMECEYCLKGLYQYCVKQINTELGGWGGLAEKMCVNYRLVVKIPNGLDQTTATILMCYGLTAYSGIKKAQLEKGSTVGVIGFGGLGSLTTKILKAMEMNATVLSHSSEKENIAKESGADDFVLTRDKTWSNSLKNSFDLLINCAPADLDLSVYLDSLKPEGKFCYLGFPFNKQQFSAAQLADYGSRSIYGSYAGSIQEINELLQLTLEKKIVFDTIVSPITHLSKMIDFVKSDESHKRVVLKW